MPASLTLADQVFIFQGEEVKWSVDQLIDDCCQPCVVDVDINQLVTKITAYAQSNDTIVVMSNGGFGGIHQKLLDALAVKYSS